MEHSESTDSLRNQAPRWSLAGDDNLLRVLQNIHQKILARCEDVDSRMEEMVTTLDHASVSLQNINNKFMMLSNTQFIESRVYDDDADVTSVADQPKPQPNSPQIQTQPDITALKRTIPVLDRLHEPVTIHDADIDSDSEDDTARLVFRPRDLYAHRPLPFIIGSHAWKTKWHAGLIVEDSDSDSAVSKGDDASDQYSESGSDGEPVHIEERTADRTISENSDLPSEQEVPTVRSQADIAAELARRLAGPLPQPVPVEPAPISYIPDDDVKHIYKPQKPAPSAIFSDEPPPMNDYHSEDSDAGDIFAELHKSQPYCNVNKDGNRLADDLFDFAKSGSSVSGDIFRDNKVATTQNKQYSSIFESNLEPDLLAANKDSSSAFDHGSVVKKPVGAVSLFGSNQEAKSIGAAILKRSQRRDSTEEGTQDVERDIKKITKNITNNKHTDRIESDMINDLFSSTDNVKKTYPQDIEKKEIEGVKRDVQTDKVTETDIFNDLFSSTDKVKKRAQKIEKEELGGGRVDIFSDNIFDDNDDIFTSSVVKRPVEDTLFEDVDDLFADIAVTKMIGSVQKSSVDKGLFDSDDDLFTDSVNVGAGQSKQETDVERADKELAKKQMNLENSRTYTSIFDNDSDSDIFSDLKPPSLSKIDHEDNSAVSVISKDNTKFSSEIDNDDRKVIATPKQPLSQIDYDKKTDVVNVAADDDPLFSSQIDNDARKVIVKPKDIKKSSSQIDYDKKTDVFNVAKDNDPLLSSEIDNDDRKVLVTPKDIKESSSQIDDDKKIDVLNVAKDNDPLLSSEIDSDDRQVLVTPKDMKLSSSQIDYDKKTDVLNVAKYNDPLFSSEIENDCKFTTPSNTPKKNREIPQTYFPSNTANNKNILTEDDNIYINIKNTDIKPSVYNKDKQTDKKTLDIDNDTTPNSEIKSLYEKTDILDEEKDFQSTIQDSYKSNDTSVVSENLSQDHTKCMESQDISKSLENTSVSNIEYNLTEEMIDDIFSSNRAKESPYNIIHKNPTSIKDVIQSVSDNDAFNTVTDEERNPYNIIQSDPTSNKDVFTSIFSEPPVFEKPKEPKRSKNVNALFDDDSDDERLFFKRNEADDGKPPTFEDKAVFDIFRDEPPAIDIDFTKSVDFEDDSEDIFAVIKGPDAVLKTDDVFKEPDAVLKGTHAAAKGADAVLKTDAVLKGTDAAAKVPDDVATETFAVSKTDAVRKDLDVALRGRDAVFKRPDAVRKDPADGLKEAFAVPNKTDTVLKDSDAVIRDPFAVTNVAETKHRFAVPRESYNTNTATVIDDFKGINPQLPLENDVKTSAMESKLQEHNSEVTKVNKLKTNIKIDVNALLPGASPKKRITQTDKQTNIHTREETDGQIITTVKEASRMESKDKTVDFEQETAMLDNKLSKERVKIQVKRRPSTRRARREAVRRSAIDEDTDNSSSIEDQPKTSTPAKEATVFDANKNFTKNDSSENPADIKVTRDVKSKIVYIINDADIFNTPNDKPKAYAEQESNTLVNKPDLFSAETSNIDKQTVSQTIVVNNNIQNVTKDKNKNDLSIFDDDDDDELFKNDRSKKSVNTSQNDSDELFNSANIGRVKVIREMKKGSLFGDDDDDDLFGKTIQKRAQTQHLPNASTSRDTSITTQPVFDDPLSLFNDED